MRLHTVSPCILLLLSLLIARGLTLTQGNGFRWFWRGSRGGSATHKVTVSSRGGSTSGQHSMVVVRVKDSTGRTVVLDSANPHTTRRVVHGFSGKGANKSTFTLTKTIGGITAGGEPLITKPAKYMRPPPPLPTKAATTPPPTTDNLVPSRWFRPPAVDATPKPVFRGTPKQTPAPQVSSRLVLARPTQKPSRAYLPPKAPRGKSLAPPTTTRPAVGVFRLTPPEEPTGLSAPTPTPASHVAKDIRRNLSGRVDGSVFFGILPVVNDLQRTPQAKTEPPPEVVISRRPGKCPFINMTRCPAPSGLAGGRCSNDAQCPADQRCCYNPCAASSQCMTAVQ